MSIYLLFVNTVTQLRTLTTSHDLLFARSATIVPCNAIKNMLRILEYLFDVNKRDETCIDLKNSRLDYGKTVRYLVGKLKSRLAKEEISALLMMVTFSSGNDLLYLMIMSMQLIDDVLEDHLSGRKAQDVVWDSIVPGAVAIEQVGLHPRCVAGILHEEVIKVRMAANSLDHQVPITKMK